MLRKYWLIALASLTAALAPVYGQRFGRNVLRQNEPPPDSEFVFARWQYGSSFGGGWSHDYPAAEEHINQVMKEATGVKVEHTSMTH